MTKWNEQNDQRLRRLVGQGRSLRDIASAFKTSQGAIEIRLSKLGSVGSVARPGSDLEESRKASVVRLSGFRNTDPRLRALVAMLGPERCEVVP